MPPRYAVPIWQPPVLPIVGSDEVFPVHRIWCVARNYAAHAREMGSDPNRDPPCFFSKPAQALVPGGGPVPYPPASSDFHYESELVVAIGKSGAGISASESLNYVYGYAVGIDLTRRDLQTVARKTGMPWDMAKGFDFSAPCGPVHPVATVGHPATGSITLTVNGQLRQSGNLGDMIWPVADILSQLSGLVTLAAGDLVFTGTPEGVGPLVRGDCVVATVAGLRGVEVLVV
ncbi:MAG: fumarylacetoacetate hydrolase family protein [Alphaproteobacteria bacterium]